MGSLVVERAGKIIRGNPLDTNTQVGAQASEEQYERIMNYISIGKAEGAEVLLGGRNDMRIFQEEIFGPVISVTTFKDEAEALAIANDTEFGLGAGVWTRDMNRAYRMGRNIQAGRVWTNCYPC